MLDYCRNSVIGFESRIVVSFSLCFSSSRDTFSQKKSRLKGHKKDAMSESIECRYEGMTHDRGGVMKLGGKHRATSCVRGTHDKGSFWISPLLPR